MSLLGGLAEGASTVAGVGTKIISTVTSLGAKAIGGVGKLFTSKLGLAALGGLGGILLLNKVDPEKAASATTKSSSGESKGFEGFMSAAKDTLSGVIGGAASLFKGLTEKVTTAAKNLFGKKDTDLDKAVDKASASNTVKDMVSGIAGGMASVMGASPVADTKDTEKDAGEEYGA